MKKSGLEYALFYNLHTGWENLAICGFFKQATAENLEALRPGDDIWIDEDPIHPNGKVYGYVCSSFKSFVDGKLYHSHGMTSFLNKVYLVTDVPGLQKYIADNPLAADLIGESGRMATAVLHGTMGNRSSNPEKN